MGLPVDRGRIEDGLAQGFPAVAVAASEEAAAVAEMARSAAVLSDFEHDGVAIAIDQDLDDLLVVARLFALSPQARAAPAVVARAPGPERFLPRLLVHEREHQHFAGRGVLRDRGDQPLAEVRTFHHEPSITAENRLEL